MTFTRRQFGSLALGASPLIGACSTGPSYEEAARNLWRHEPLARTDALAVQRELVRCATLAPSSHNTQCWRFGIEPNAIALAPDYTRRCPAVDPDDHHLFVSLGCAAQNLEEAALAHGLKANLTFDAAGRTLRAALEPTAAQASALYQAMAHRQSTRAPYDGQPLASDELRRLEQAAAVGGVQMLLLTSPRALEDVLAFVVDGNRQQMRDPVFMAELKAWIRFSASDAVRTGDGLYAASSGNPSVPAWLGRAMFGLFFTDQGETDKYTQHVRSSAGLAVFVGPSNDPAGWVQVGRAYERFALQATALGVRTAHLNQPVEVPALRQPFARLLGIGGQRPDLVVRFGRGPALPPSLRRPVAAVLA